MNDKFYKDKKTEIEAMSKEERMNRLEDLSTELFIIANSFAGNETGDVACYLHESVNHINTAQKIFTGEREKGIPVDFLMRSMGLGMGTSLIDLQIKDEQYAEDLEKENE